MGCIQRSPPMPFVMNFPICFQVVCLFVDLHVGMCTMACVWKSENNLQLLFFPTLWVTRNVLRYTNLVASMYLSFPSELPLRSLSSSL